MAAPNPRLTGDATGGESTVDDPKRASQARRLTPEALQERMRRSLSVSNPPDNSDRLAADRECQIQLRVTDIDPYDRNPRRTRNQLYAEIKESIRAARVISPITVTKRPGSTRYMVGAGGNTRLQAQRELWDETGDARFEFLLVTDRPWVSEAQVLTAHLVENELHAGMSFWDKAVGVGDLKQELERAAGKSLSLRQLQELVKQEGLALSVTLLSFYGFALTNLSDLGSGTRLLSTTAVRDLQPVFAFLASYLEAHGRGDQEWHALRARVLQDYAQTLPRFEEAGDSEAGPPPSFDAAALIQQLELAVADMLAQNPSQVRDVRQLLKTVPGANLPDVLNRYETHTRASSEPSGEKPSRSESDFGRQGELASGAVEPRPSPVSEPLHSEPDTLGSAVHGKSSKPGRAQGSDRESAQPFAPDPLAQVQHAAARFAEICELGDLIRISNSMPSGYFVEAPADGQAIDADHRALRYGAWWILAMHSGQIDGSYSDRMPTDSLWRQAQRMEADEDENALAWLIETVLGSPIGLVELGQWLTDCPGPALEAYQDLVIAIRHLRSAVPDRFMLDGGDE